MSFYLQIKWPPKKQKQQFLRVYCAKKPNDHLTEQKTPFQSVQFMINTKTDSVLIKKVVFEQACFTLNCFVLLISVHWF